MPGMRLRNLGNRSRGSVSRGDDEETEVCNGGGETGSPAPDQAELVDSEPEPIQQAEYEEYDPGLPDYYVPLAESEIGPMFRRTWKDDEAPLCILGKSFYNEVALYIVRLEPQTEEEVARVLEDPSDDLNPSNSVIVAAKDFNQWFPEIFMNSVEQSMGFVTKAGPRVVECKKPKQVNKVYPPYSKFRRDFLSNLKDMKVAVTDEMDSFGETLFEEDGDDDDDFSGDEYDCEEGVETYDGKAINDAILDSDMDNEVLIPEDVQLPPASPIQPRRRTKSY